MSKSTTEIRQEFLDFFYNKGHRIVSSSSLVPINDPTLLFTNAGMNQFKNIFLGYENCMYKRVTTSQKCIRVSGKHNDLENVGYTTCHHTFFEMLGNFSFGDYFKHDSIHFAWELLTSPQWFNLCKDNLWVTVYVNDIETFNIWANEIKIPIKKIIRIGDYKNSISHVSNNFWQMGDTGPCGPCSEIFYDYGDHIYGDVPGKSKKHNKRYIEIWNLVFMEFDRQLDGTLLKLPKPSVDTGMGLERISTILQKVYSNYDIDLFKKLITITSQIINIADLNNKSLRVITDHIRSCAFLIADGVIPSNEGRGYVLRRIIRRAIRHGNMLGVNSYFFYKLVSPLIEVMGSIADSLKTQQTMIEQELLAEEELFAYTLKRGMSLLEIEMTKIKNNTFNGEAAFKLYDTYGFPVDFIIDICNERNLCFDKIGFEQAMNSQREKSRKSNCFIVNYINPLYSLVQTTFFVGYDKLKYEGNIIALLSNGQLIKEIRSNEEVIIVLDKTPFYSESGGQVGDRGEIKTNTGLFTVINTKKYGNIFGHIGRLKYGTLKIETKAMCYVDFEYRNSICLNHSATHLLNSALRQVFGNKYIEQRGSLINEEYIRFDFSYYKTISVKDIRSIEDIVNQHIRNNLLIETNIMTFKEACDKGAITLPNKKYESYVRVLNIGDFSIELCGGTHVSHTGNIGLFHIISVQGVSAGIRRIKAVTGSKALKFFYETSDLMKVILKLTYSNNYTVINKIQKLQKSAYELEKEIYSLKKQLILHETKLLIHNVRYTNGIKYLIDNLNNIEKKMLHFIVRNLKNQLGSSVIVLITINNKKIKLIASVSNDLINRIKASDIIDIFSQKMGCKGGGNFNFAQAEGGNIKVLSNTLEYLNSFLILSLSKNINNI